MRRPLTDGGEALIGLVLNPEQAVVLRSSLVLGAASRPSAAELNPLSAISSRYMSHFPDIPAVNEAMCSMVPRSRIM